MRIRTLSVVSLLTALCLSGCPGDYSRTEQQPTAKGPYTILCRKFGGPTQFNDAQQHLKALESWNMTKGYTVREAGGTIVYYGYYERAGTDEVKGDLEKLTNLRYGRTGPLVFPGVRLVPVPQPEEEYYPLSEAKGKYSLEVAVFYGPQAEGRTRQESARVFARYLREEKQEEAYVYDGPTVSSVCLGAFPEEAIEFPTRLLPLDLHGPRFYRDEAVGNLELALQTKVVDPRAQALKERWPYKFHNGKYRMTIWRYVQGTQKIAKRVRVPSVFVPIPGTSADEGLIP